MVCDKVVCDRWCLKDGVWQSGVPKTVGDKVVCEWCVQVMCDKVVCDKAVCVTKPHQHSTICVKDDVWQSCVWQSCVWQIGATPATQHTGGCRQVPSCHANGTSMSPSATPATRNERGCHQVPRLPRKVKVMSPSATPATQSGAAPRATNRAQARHQSQPSAISTMPQTQSEGGCHQVPRLPRKWNVNVTKCHACRATGAAPRATKARPSAPPKYHACHAKWRWMSPSAMPATQMERQCHACPATQSGAAPRATKLRPSAPPEPAQCHKYRACHAKWRWMSPSATPATQMERQCHQVPRLPCEVERRPGRLKRAQARHHT